MPFTTGLAAVLTAVGVLGFAPAIAAAAPAAAHGNTTRDQEWWLASLHVTQAWQQSEGSGITVAVLGTGVDASYPGLAGSVITGPDYTGSAPMGRGPGGPYWGLEGTAVAGIIAAHERGWGLVGVAPAAKILSVRVTLEFNDPLASDQAISQRLPGAIAAGVSYAADHGARIIDLPLDPGTLGLTGNGDPAAAGGSPAERAAIGHALSKGIVLVAPAGDDGQGPGIVNYPAAYPGVIAVGAIGRTGQLASFTSRRSYASLTAPGVSLVVAAQPDGYGTISSTSTSSGIVAGVAALVLSRFPHLTVAQVTQALIESTTATAAATTGAGAGLPPLPARSTAGRGYGTVDAIRALDLAAIITSASQPRLAAPSAAPRRPPRRAAAAPHRPAATALAGSVLRDAVAAVCVLIVLLVVALLVVRSRRDRGRSAAADRKRIRGQHENRRPGRGPAAAAGLVTADDARAPRGPKGSRPPQAARPGPPAWTSPAGWQGGGIGEISPAQDGLYGPVVAQAPKPSADYRTGRGAGRREGDPGPPWEPAPEPERPIGSRPVASAGLPPPEPGRGIRVPGDMAAPGATADPSLPVSFDLTTPPADFDLTTPAFGLTPPAFDVAPLAAEAAPPAGDVAPPAGDVATPAAEAAPPQAEAAPPAAPDAEPRTEAPPTRASLGFAAAPVAEDYAAPPAELALDGDPGPARAADPSYIWDLAATDVFPAATDGAGAPSADEG
jgi:hypothetical protein